MELTVDQLDPFTDVGAVSGFVPAHITGRVKAGRQWPSWTPEMGADCSQRPRHRAPAPRPSTRAPLPDASENPTAHMDPLASRSLQC